jgi:hypothetical protein
MKLGAHVMVDKPPGIVDQLLPTGRRHIGRARHQTKTSIAFSPFARHAGIKFDDGGTFRESFAFQGLGSPPETRDFRGCPIVQYSKVLDSWTN